MKQSSKLLFTAVAAAAIVATAAWALDVDVTGDLEMPEVIADVDFKGGELPDVDVEAVDVDIQEKQAKVDIPTDVNIDVETKEATIPYPSIDVEKPEEDTYAEEDDLQEMAN